TAPAPASQRPTAPRKRSPRSLRCANAVWSGHAHMVLETDYLVIGSGIAGFNFALLAAEHGKVVVVTKKKTTDTNTNWAQGGVAAVLAKDDTFERHVEDTLVAGDGL